MPFCPECGGATETSQDFCRTCGARLPEIVQKPAGPGSAPGGKSPTAHHSSAPAHHADATLSPKARLSPLLIAGLAGILIIIGVAAFFMLSGLPHPVGMQNTSNASRDSGGVPPVSGQCSAGLSLCSGSCVDFRTDQNNCGGCGFTVPFGESCINGQFSSSLEKKRNVSPTALAATTTAAMKGSCPPGQTSCNGICRDLRTDTGNCGSCGNACPAGQFCQDGLCTLTGTSAPATTTQPITLVMELSCSGGETACGSSCVNLFSDKKNCGVCNRTCKSQEICMNARCGPACTEDTTLCDETCVDLNTDMNNCGACGTECETLLPNIRGTECSYGECIISGCKADYGDCNKNIADGCEVFLVTNTANCGTCGKTCPSGQVCYDKKCSAPITL